MPMSTSDGRAQYEGWMLTIVRRYSSPKQYLDAAGSPDTAPVELEELAVSPYSFVKLAVANNPNASQRALEILAPSAAETPIEQELAGALVRNPKTPVQTLAKLAEMLTPLLDHRRGHEIAFDAGLELCRNPVASFDTLARILQSPNVAVRFRSAVATYAKRRDVLELLLNDRSEKVRRKAISRLSSGFPM